MTAIDLARTVREAAERVYFFTPDETRRIVDMVTAAVNATAPHGVKLDDTAPCDCDRCGDHRARAAQAIEELIA